jgi:hypothetical protein
VIHSPTEKSPWSVFHKQLLLDALTIDEIARKVLEELAAYKKPDKKPDTPKPLLTYLLLVGLGSVGIQDSHPGLVVIQAADGSIRFD